MNEDMFKIAGVLSDRTRYAIYDYVCNKYNGVSVQDVADKFSIHPNVARLHLSKLEDVSLIRSELDKKPKGGRPNKLYMMSNETISFNFPHRDFSLVTMLAMKTIANLGPFAWKTFIAESYKYGKILGHNNKVSLQLNEDSSVDEITQGIRITLEKLGLNPKIEIIDSENLLFNVRNCTFKDCAKLSPESLCQAHQKVLKGIFEAFFENLRFQPVKTMQNFDSCNFCHYKLQLVPANK
jgi:predicted ArsR family transcriptional regulator